MLEPQGESQPGQRAVITGGDRALALRSWFGPCWELLNREQVRDWVKVAKMPWDSAVPGQSCFRDAMLRVIGDETADVLGAIATGVLIVVE
eukprot:3291215-Pyramimonas_sp.AAC.1